MIISDTHGKDFIATQKPRQNVDVAIHCGDLTDSSKLEEYRTAIKLLKAINAPLKLVIAGNHDFTLDIPAFERKLSEAEPPIEPALVAKTYGVYGEARQLFEEAKDDDITFLDEGNHSFTLANGASLNVYASPYTPSFGAWGFQYHPDKGHAFAISPGTDIAITHGPPRGVMDYTHGRERAGCPDLFAAIARARPRVHCFGHIHEGWGARMVTWREPPRTCDDEDDSASRKPTHSTAFINTESPVVEKLSTLPLSKFDSDEDTLRKAARHARLEEERCIMTRHGAHDEFPLRQGEQTLFVNAAIESAGENMVQRPWIVELELERA